MYIQQNVRFAICSWFSGNDDMCNATVKAIASDYISAGLVINRVASFEINVMEMKDICGLLFPITSDKNTSTCVPAVKGLKQLQAIFITPSLVPTNQLSVEVILLNVDDCSSPAWTWFVESECQPGVFTECSRNQLTRVEEFTHCVVICTCVDSCDFLHLKYNRLPLRNQTSEKLCEIWAHRNGYNQPFEGWTNWLMIRRRHCGMHVLDRSTVVIFLFNCYWRLKGPIDN